MMISIPIASKSIEKKKTNHEFKFNKDIISRYLTNRNWENSLTDLEKRSIENNITQMVEAFVNDPKDVILFKLKRFRTISVPDFVRYVNFKESLKQGYIGWKLVHISKNVVELSTIKRSDKDIKLAVAYRTLLSKFERNEKKTKKKE